MIAALFLNFGFLFVAATLVSVPIIIHLINRMRFKRVRWAAMEFLLKAQKRTRKRLIIEQLLLLMLRCMLIALVGLLVSRFIGCSDTNLTGKPNLHLVLLDDSLSMQDKGKQGNECFEVARDEILTKKIAKGLLQSKTNDKLIILPLSKIEESGLLKPVDNLSDQEREEEMKKVVAKLKVFDHLNDKERNDELKKDIAKMQPTKLSISMVEGLKAAHRLIDFHKDTMVTLHVVSDYRQNDWGLPAGETVTRDMLDLVKKNPDVKVRLIDTVYPVRDIKQGGYPTANDNVGIVDFRPSTRIAGKNMLVQFTVSVKNFSGKQVDVKLTARDESTGKDMDEVDFRPQHTLKLPPDSLTNVTFEQKFKPELKPGESYFANLSVRLTTPQLRPLDNDGLQADNIRYAVVEVREKVPVLVIDGDPKGLEDSKDSFVIDRALQSVTGASYDVVFGSKAARGGPAGALELPNLIQYPTIFLLNVPKLTPKQLTNLENYVKEGGGVAFFLGKDVDVSYYNKFLYKDGKGVFPAPLQDPFYPSPNDPALEPKSQDTDQLLVRDDNFPGGSVPIFGAMFEDPKVRATLADLPIRRYFKVNRNDWKPQTNKVYELATLPNDVPITTYTDKVVSEIVQGPFVKAIRANAELAKYRASLNQHLIDMMELVKPGSEKKAYHLAAEIEKMLNDKGDPQKKEVSPDLTDFWVNGDASVQSLKRDLTNLRLQVYYGDPYVVTSNFGKGKVVAVMSTAGKDWNDWAGGPASEVLFVPFILEMQTYLSSQGSEANLTVGTDLPIHLDATLFPGMQLKVVRSYLKPMDQEAAKKVAHGDPQFGKHDGAQISFKLGKHLEPGVYITELMDANPEGKGLISTRAHAFNVDTAHEGQLHRIGTEDLDREILSKSKSKEDPEGSIRMVVPGAPEDQLVGKVNDFSESPWLFLILLLVLVAEQALAVHLSFHLKSGEDASAPPARVASRAA